MAHLSWPPPANQGLPLEDLFGGQVDAGAGCSSDPFASTLQGEYGLSLNQAQMMSDLLAKVSANAKKAAEEEAHKKLKEELREKKSKKRALEEQASVE